MDNLHLCKATQEQLLRRELAALKAGDVYWQGLGWARSRGGRLQLPRDLCFAYASLLKPVDLKAASVNAMVGQLADYFGAAFRDEKVAGSWPVVFDVAPGVEGLGGRAAVLENAWLECMRGRMSRVFKLASVATPAANVQHTGLYAYLWNYESLFVSCRFQVWGQRRMKDDPAAPSRSYLKVEEAYGILGREPAPGETVADLGAAPGGWSFSAAQRGARVVAVDNGPLKAGALEQPLIEHRCEDAFFFRPANGQIYDWLFCDIIENPYRILELAEQWLSHGWCRHVVINLKMGHHDPIMLLERARDTQRGLAAYCSLLRVRHLHHDREEITVVGSV